MLSFAFGYFIGQNVAWLLSSWVVSLLVCAVLPLIVFVVDASSAPRAFTTLLGWASVAALPEFVLKTRHSTFDGEAKNQLLPILAAFDALIFVVLTIVVNVNDSAPVLWIILLAMHVVYVWGIWHINIYAKRVHDPRNYFVAYMAVVVVNDLYFFIVSLIVHGHPLNFVSVLIAAVLTGLALLLATHHKTISEWTQMAPAPSVDAVEE